eukprot:scaffold552419_cov19-Prasinocladus_malaysianus.AAC.2
MPPTCMMKQKPRTRTRTRAERAPYRTVPYQYRSTSYKYRTVIFFCGQPWYEYRTRQYVGRIQMRDSQWYSYESRLETSRVVCWSRVSRVA